MGWDGWNGTGGLAVHTYIHIYVYVYCILYIYRVGVIPGFVDL